MRYRTSKRQQGRLTGSTTVTGKELYPRVVSQSERGIFLELSATAGTKTRQKPFSSKAHSNRASGNAVEWDCRWKAGAACNRG